MLKKILSILVIAILVMSAFSSVSAEYVNGATNWTYPTGSEWKITYKNAGYLYDDCRIYELNNPHHEIKAVDKGDKKLDASYRGKPIVIHGYYSGVPNDLDILIPYYPGGTLDIVHDYQTAVKGYSWFTITLNGNWKQSKLGYNADGKMVIFDMPEDFRLQLYYLLGGNHVI
jgi:hypothetical protein